MRKTILLLLSALLLLACVPTPDQEFITHKDMDAMLEKAAATPAQGVVTVEVPGAEKATGGEPPVAPRLREQYGFPTAWVETFSEADGHFAVQIDAPVEVPDASAMPIVRVERGTYDPDVIKRMFDTLTAGRTLVLRNPQMTKTEIANRIVYLEDEINDPNSDFDAEDRAWAKAQIEQLKAQYADAPDTKDEPVADGVIRPIPLVSSKTGEVVRMLYGFEAISQNSNPDNIPENFAVIIPDFADAGHYDEEFGYGGGDARMWYMNPRSRLTGSDYDTKILLRDPAEPKELAAYPHVTYTPAQAITDAEAFLSSVGLDRYQADRVAFLPDKDTDAYGYCIFCVPTTAGVPGTSLWMGTWAQDGVTAPPWDYEFMRLCIDEQGVYALFWYAPLKEKETVLSSAALLPFEKIMEIFRKHVWIKEKPWLILDESIVIEKDYPSDMLVRIDRITLSLQRVMEPNTFDTALLVPVWNFWGSEITTRTDLQTRQTTEEPGSTSPWPPTPILSINAIDGSVIDLMKGY